MRAGTGGAHGTVEAFLSAFKRRSLTLSLLRLSLVAAVTNEAVRWAAIASNTFLGTGLPILSIGPLLLIVLSIHAVRRWSRAVTASRADTSLDFRDRLASYVDFSSRRDIPDELRRAQAVEVASSLGSGDIRRLAPVKPLFIAGPILLLVSVFYPYWWKTTPMAPSAFRSVMTGDPSTAPGTLPLSPASGDGHDLLRDRPRPPGPDKRDLESAETDQPAIARTPLPSGDPAKKAEEGQERDSRRRKPLVTERADEGGKLVSKPVGSELSKIVDPVYSPLPDSPARSPKRSGGTVSFRLLPRAQAGGGARGENTFGESPSRSVTIDLDGIPARYRSIVREYFSLLAGGGPTSPDSEKESL